MTWSILVRDPATGAMGAAVATRFFAVGALAIHAEGGIAALATQAHDQPDVCAPWDGAAARRRSTRRRRRGIAGRRTPGRTIASCTSSTRQGRIAQHTGSGLRLLVRCRAGCGRLGRRQHAGRPRGGGTHFGRLSSARTGTLAERLLTALEAGEAAGGDKRGRQSAALKICTRDPYPDLDIRTDDHPDPLAELRRLHRVSQERFAVFRRFLAGADSPAACSTAR